MKTDHDVLRETLRHYFEREGATPEQAEANCQQFLKLFQSMNPRPPKPLTDAEYEQTLAKMKSSAASDVARLLKNFPPIENN